MDTIKKISAIAGTVIISVSGTWAIAQSKIDYKSLPTTQIEKIDTDNAKRTELNVIETVFNISEEIKRIQEEINILDENISELQLQRAEKVAELEQINKLK